jgi:hypothetical protein
MGRIWVKGIYVAQPRLGTLDYIACTQDIIIVVKVVSRTWNMKVACDIIQWHASMSPITVTRCCEKCVNLSSASQLRVPFHCSVACLQASFLEPLEDNLSLELHD